MLGGEIGGLDAETVRLLRHKMPAHSSNDAASIILEPGESVRTSVSVPRIGGKPLSSRAVQLRPIMSTHLVLLLYLRPFAEGSHGMREIHP